MKHSIDNLLEQYTKYLLIHSDPDESIAYLIMYLINKKYPNGVQSFIRLKVVSWIQNIFDTLNPHVENTFSSFDVELEGLPDELRIVFYNDNRENGWVRNTINIKRENE